MSQLEQGGGLPGSPTGHAAPPCRERLTKGKDTRTQNYVSNTLRGGYNVKQAGSMLGL